VVDQPRTRVTITLLSDSRSTAVTRASEGLGLLASSAEEWSKAELLEGLEEGGEGAHESEHD
jgi:hypothetical protein